MSHRYRFRPQLEALEDRLSPSSLMNAPPAAAGGIASHASSSPSAVLPPQSHAFGTSLSELGVRYAQQAIESQLGGGTDLGDRVGRVQFLPTSVTESVAEFHVSLRPGTPFFTTPFFVFGESYDDPAVPDDTPQDVRDLRIFETAQIRTVLDGRVVLEGTGTELARFGFGPVYFDEPIVYTEPQPRGPGLSATSALFVQGIGAVFHPLPVGSHTLVTTVSSEFFGDLQYTYHITVSPRG